MLITRVPPNPNLMKSNLLRTVSARLSLMKVFVIILYLISQIWIINILLTYNSKLDTDMNHADVAEWSFVLGTA